MLLAGEPAVAWGWDYRWGASWATRWIAALTSCIAPADSFHQLVLLATTSLFWVQSACIKSCLWPCISAAVFQQDLNCSCGQQLNAKCFKTLTITYKGLTFKLWYFIFYQPSRKKAISCWKRGNPISAVV